MGKNEFFVKLTNMHTKVGQCKKGSCIQISSCKWKTKVHKLLKFDEDFSNPMNSISNPMNSISNLMNFLNVRWTFFEIRWIFFKSVNFFETHGRFHYCELFLQNVCTFSISWTFVAEFVNIFEYMNLFYIGQLFYACSSTIQFFYIFSIHSRFSSMFSNN